MSTTRWIRDLFVDDHQYALFGYVQGQYLAQLADFVEFINEDALKAKLKDFPPFDPGRHTGFDKEIFGFDYMKQAIFLLLHYNVHVIHAYHILSSFHSYEQH